MVNTQTFEMDEDHASAGARSAATLCIRRKSSRAAAIAFHAKPRLRSRRVDAQSAAAFHVPAPVSATIRETPAADEWR